MFIEFVYYDKVTITWALSVNCILTFCHFDLYSNGGQNQTNPFKCELCWSRFSRKDSLKRHMSKGRCKGAPPKIYCKHCQQEFNTTWRFGRHIRLMHTEVNPLEQKNDGLFSESEDETMSPWADLCIHFYYLSSNHPLRVSKIKKNPTRAEILKYSSYWDMTV